MAPKGVSNMAERKSESDSESEFTPVSVDSLRRVLDGLRRLG